MENFMAGDGIRLSFSIPSVPPFNNFVFSWLSSFLFRWTWALQCHWQTKNSSFWLFLLPNINSNSCNTVDGFLLFFFLPPFLVLINWEASTTFICFLCFYFLFLFFILLERLFPQVTLVSYLPFPLSWTVWTGWSWWQCGSLFPFAS